MRRRARAPRTLALALTLALAACAPARGPDPSPSPAPASSPPPASSVAAPARFALPPATAAWYKAAARDGAVLRIDPARSLIVVTVRRGGALARLGHDHVVASHAIEGLVAPAAGRADFGFRLDALAVDEAPLRAAAQLDTQPSPDAIAGTRTNMLTRVLEAERFPEVALAVTGALPGGEAASAMLTVAVTLHGVTRSVPTEARISRSGTTLAASGSLTLRQSDFGITPMSIFNGALTVQDTMALRYDIVAAPAPL